MSRGLTDTVHINTSFTQHLKETIDLQAIRYRNNNKNCSLNNIWNTHNKASHYFEKQYIYLVLMQSLQNYLILFHIYMYDFTMCIIQQLVISVINWNWKNSQWMWVQKLSHLPLNPIWWKAFSAWGHAGLTGTEILSLGSSLVPVMSMDTLTEITYSLAIMVTRSEPYGLLPLGPSSHTVMQPEISEAMHLECSCQGLRNVRHLWQLQTSWVCSTEACT
jgi:hypothetical protein